MERKTRVRAIEIIGMTGAACVQKVLAALKQVSGVTIDGVQVGKAEIICGYPAALSAACAAIGTAGFRAIAVEGPNDVTQATPAKRASRTPGPVRAAAPVT